MALQIVKYQRSLTIPKIWRKATVIATPKPNKPTDDPKNYRPISLLCVPFKILERLLLARLEPVIDPLLPDEQAGFRRGRSTVHQIVNLTDDIEEAFEKGQKAGVVLVDLTAAYDTVWHHGLILKLLQTIPDRHLVRFLSTIISNRSFILKTSDGQVSRMRRLKNGVPQGSVLAPTLFNIYLSDLPSTSSSKYAYADDLALLYSDRSWSMVENVLSSDMDILATYLRMWRLKLSTAKTTSTPFTLNTKEAHRQLSVKLDGSTLPCNPTPTGSLPSSDTLNLYVAKFHQGTISCVVLLALPGEPTQVPSVQVPSRLSTALQNMPRQSGAGALIPRSWMFPSTTP